MLDFKAEVISPSERVARKRLVLRRSSWFSSQPGVCFPPGDSALTIALFLARCCPLLSSGAKHPPSCLCRPSALPSGVRRNAALAALAAGDSSCFSGVVNPSPFCESWPLRVPSAMAWWVGWSLLYKIAKRCF